MASGQGQAQPRTAFRANKIEFAAEQAAVLNIFSAKIGVSRGRAKRHDATRRNLRETRHARIAGIQHGHALAPREAFDQFALGQSNFVNRSEKFQMHGCDARDHAHVRARDFRQPF